MIMAAALVSPAAMMADEIIIEDYFQGFEGYAGTGQFPPGWEVVTDLPEGSTTTFAYTIEASGGKQVARQNNIGRAYLNAADQQPSGGSVYLVTPPVKGKVKFVTQAKSWSYKGPLQFFKMVKDTEGNLVAGEELTITGSVFSNSYSWEYTEPYVMVDDYCRIGIKMSYGKLDCFNADEALVPEYYGLMIDNSTFPHVPSGNISADATGLATIRSVAGLLNYGTKDIEPGMEGYNVMLVRNTQDSVVFTAPVTKLLKAGAGANDTLDMEYHLLDPTKDENSVYFKLREGLFNTETSQTQKTIKAYVARLDVKDGTSSLSKGTVQRLGLMQGQVSKSWNFVNSATAPLEITGFTLPQGVSCAHELPFTIEPGVTEAFEFVFAFDTEGVYEETIGIQHNGNSESITEIPFMLAYAGENTYANDFTEGMPAAWLNGEGGKNFGREQLVGNYYLYAGDDAARIVTPKITFAEDQKLIFGGARTTSSPYKEQYIIVSYSPDRVEWTQAKRISSKDNPTAFDPSTTLRSLKYFTVDSIPEGDWYIAFESKCGIIDDVFGGVLTPGVHDIAVGSVSAPSSGMVNYPVTVKAGFRNMGPAKEAAGSYTLTLMSGDEEVVKLADTPDLEYSYTPTEFTLSFTPHAPVDSMPLHVVFNLPLETGDITLSTDTVAVKILPEVMVADVNVGNVTTSTNSNVPYYGNYNNSVTEFIYTAEQLNLTPGSVISSVTFYRKQGIPSASQTPLLRNIKMWMDNTEKTQPERLTGNDSKVLFADTTNMVLVHHNIYDHSEASSKEVINEYEKWVIQLDQPFVYNGENLRFIVRSESNHYATCSFASFSASQQALYFNNDTYNNYKHVNSSGELQTCSASYASGLPCMALGLVVTAPQISGKVLSGEQPVENAMVKLTSGDVLYSGTTDTEGAFSIDILQPSHEYTLTAALPAHVDAVMEPAQYSESTQLDDIVLDRNEISAESYNVTVDDAAAGTLTLTWSPVYPGSMDEGVTYTVTLDGEVKAEGLTECTYTLTDVAEGTHVVGVKAVFLPSMLESSLVEASPELTGIGSLTVNGAAVYAVNGGVDVVSAGNAEVRVISASGRVVTVQPVTAGTTTIALPAGIYVVELRGTATIVRKVAVK